MSNVFFKNVRVLQRSTRDSRLIIFSHYEMHNAHLMSVYKSCSIYSCQVAKSRNTSFDLEMHGRGQEPWERGMQSMTCAALWCGVMPRSCENVATSLGDQGVVFHIASF
jgi:hypothetical protein